MGSSKKQTVGYAYFMGLHMALCKGPVDAVLAIRAAGRDIFTGTRWTGPAGAEHGNFPHPYEGNWRQAWSPSGPFGPITGNERVMLAAPDAFGGKQREGGIMGALDVMFGGADQGPNDYLESRIGVAQPGYRQILSAVFRGGMVGAMNPYLKAWEFRVRRNLAGWEGGTWYPAKCQVPVGGGVLCMNPAHIVYQVLTDSMDGMAYPRATLDDASFRDAADLFHAEGLGLFMKWVRSDRIEAFIQQVLDHCSAMLVQNPTTALFELVPLRDDYNPSELLTLTPDDATLEMFERATLEETVNEITVKWDDTHTRAEGSVTVQELANIQAMGGVVNQTKTYGGCPTEAIAKRLAQRDLEIGSALLARCRIRVNRKAYGVIPGRCIALEGFAKMGLGRVIVRALRVNYGSSGERSILIEGAEDVFGLPVNSYVGDPGAGWTPPNTTPLPSPNTLAYEAPFRDVAQVMGAAQVAALSPAAGFLGLAAQHPGGIPINYTLVTRTGSAPYAEAGVGDFSPTAVLASPIGKQDTILALASLSQWAQVRPGTVIFVGAMPGAEAMRVDGVTGLSVTVARGTLDTVPKAWPSGARVWAYDEYGSADPAEYAAGETISAKPITNTSTGTLAESLAPTATVTMASRLARPYPPARFRINGEAWPASAPTARLALSWRHRDRIMAADVAIGTEEPSMGPEPGTTYRVRVYREPSTLLHEQAGIAAEAYTWDAVMATPGDVRVEVVAQRAGLDSWQAQAHVLAVPATVDLVTNGGFNADTDWTKGTGWTISTGSGRKEAGVASALSQPIAFVAGGVYRVTFTTSISAGSVTPRFAGGTVRTGTARAASGTYTQELVANAGNTTLELYGDAACVCSVDNVAVLRLA